MCKMTMALTFESLYTQDAYAACRWRGKWRCSQPQVLAFLPCAEDGVEICVQWLIPILCVTWLILMCDMTRFYVWHDTFLCVSHSYGGALTLKWSPFYHAQKISMCDMTHSNVYLLTCAKDGVWHDSFLCEIVSIPTCDMTHFYVWHDSFQCVSTNMRKRWCVTWLIPEWDRVHSYVWHDSFLCVTWLIPMCIY